MRQELEREKKVGGEKEGEAEGRVLGVRSQSVHCQAGESHTGTLPEKAAVTASDDEALSRVLELEAGLASATEERRGLLERLIATRQVIQSL